MIAINDTDLFLGDDKRVYRQTRGTLTAYIPVEVPDDDCANLTEWDASRVPLLSEVRAVFDQYMKKYSHETLVWWGQDRQDPTLWRWIVPEQECTTAGVEADDETAMLQLSAVARWGGSIHTHPGDSAGPSGIDTDQWEDAEQAGLHFIVARDASYTLNAVVGGHTFTIEKGKLPEAQGCPVVETSGGRELDQLIKRPKPARIITGRKREQLSQYQIGCDAEYQSNEMFPDFVRESDRPEWWDQDERFNFDRIPPAGVLEVPTDENILAVGWRVDGSLIVGLDLEVDIGDIMYTDVVKWDWIVLSRKRGGWALNVL